MSWSSHPMLDTPYSFYKGSSGPSMLCVHTPHGPTYIPNPSYIESVAVEDGTSTAETSPNPQYPCKLPNSSATIYWGNSQVLESSALNGVSCNGMKANYRAKLSHVNETTVNETTVEMVGGNSSVLQGAEQVQWVANDCWCPFSAEKGEEENSISRMSSTASSVNERVTLGGTVLRTKRSIDAISAFDGGVMGAGNKERRVGETSHFFNRFATQDSMDMIMQ